jgi:hypothetical protein
MQDRQDIDGSQRPETKDAPGAAARGAEAGHLGRGGDPVEGRDPDDPATLSQQGPSGTDHLGPAGDPSEGKTGDAATGQGAD